MKLNWWDNYIILAIFTINMLAYITFQSKTHLQKKCYCRLFSKYFLNSLTIKQMTWNQLQSRQKASFTKKGFMVTILILL